MLDPQVVQLSSSFTMHFNMSNLNVMNASSTSKDMMFLQEGVVYAVEFSLRSGRDLVNMAKKRTNVVPIVEDARHPHKYRMVCSMVDTIFADVAQPDQARIVALNAQHFLKVGGHYIISIKANCIDSTAPAEAVFAGEIKKLQSDLLKPQEQLTLEPYERDHAVVVGVYRPPKKNKG